MKRFFTFIKLLFFLDLYLHQSYAYDDGNEGSLHVECVINGKKIETQTSLTSPFPWITALWNIARAALAAAGGE